MLTGSEIDISEIGAGHPASAACLSASAKDERLALLGGSPAFARTMQVGRPNLPSSDAFLARINRMLESGRLTNAGPMMGEFEHRIAEISQVRHCIATCNGTLALDVLLDALGLAGSVVVPSFTFVATVHALRRRGLRPIFCDVDPETHCLDPVAVEKAIEPDTSAILTVTLWGNMGGLTHLREIADRRGLRLLCDAAHSFGCGPNDGVSAALCDAEVYSFHATKFVHAIEGGAIATNDDALAAKVRLMINFGFDGEDAVAHIGTNAKMNEAEAAMGLTSLDAMDEIVVHNRANLEAYAEGLANVPGVRLMRQGDEQRRNHHYIVAEVDAARAGLTRDHIVSALRSENVLARRYFYPGVHRTAAYREWPTPALPVTEALSCRVMVLPNGLAVASRDALRIARRIAAMVEHSADVRAALSKAQGGTVWTIPLPKARLDRIRVMEAAY